jgi:hypothetical protein
VHALSVFQPWASLLVHGVKQVETRPWRTAHRGLLAVHASARLPPADRALCGHEPFRSALRQAGLDPHDQLPLGAVLGTVRLLDCVRVEELPHLPARERSLGDFRPGRWAWLLGDPSPWPTPRPARGRLGIYQLPIAPPA